MDKADISGTYTNILGGKTSQPVIRGGLGSWGDGHRANQKFPVSVWESFIVGHSIMERVLAGFGK